MNLKNVTVQELNNIELLTIEGGSDGGDWAMWGLGQIIDHWKAIKKGFNDGMNGVYNNPY